MAYSLLAVDFMSPEAMHAALMRISAGLAASQLHPLPLISHSMGAVPAALRQMSQARHVGKVVVRHAPAQSQEMLAGSWLVTGGVGARLLCLSCSRLANASLCVSCCWDKNFESKTVPSLLLQARWALLCPSGCYASVCVTWPLSVAQAPLLPTALLPWCRSTKPQQSR